MILTLELSLYELLFFVATIFGGFFALLQWRQSYKLKRAELLKEAVSKIRDDTTIAEVLYTIDYGEEWYTTEFIKNHSIEQKYDKVFAYFDYLCYLKSKRVLSRDEFRIFEYRLIRLTNNQSFLDYMFNLYHFSMKNGTDISFYYLLKYLRDNTLLPNSFWDVHSANFKKILNI